MRWLAPLFAAVLFAACVAASASEPRTSALIVAGADSVYATPEYVGFDATTEQNGPVDSVRFTAWLGSDSAATAQSITGKYGILTFVRFAWPTTLFPPNVAQAVSYGIAYGRNQATGPAWSAATVKTASFTNVFLAPLPPVPSKVRLRAGPGYN